MEKGTVLIRTLGLSHNYVVFVHVAIVTGQDPVVLPMHGRNNVSINLIRQN